MKLKPVTSVVATAMLFAMGFNSCQKAVLTERLSTDDLQSQASLSAFSGDLPTNPLYEIDSIGKSTQFFKQSNRAAFEKERLKLFHTPTQLLPTGLYVQKDSSIHIHVSLETGAALPAVMMGTYKRLGEGNPAPTQIQLKAGANVITAAKDGMIWVVYVGDNPNSKAKLHFSGAYKKVPTFIKNKTSTQDWQNQLSTLDNPTKDVLMIGRRVYMVFSKDVHAAVGTQNNNKVLDNADDTFDKEDDFSGLDGSSALHSRQLIPHLMVHAPHGIGDMWATSFHTFYVSQAF